LPFSIIKSSWVKVPEASQAWHVFERDLYRKLRRKPPPYLRAQYEQVKRRRGRKKAIGAVAHSILIASYHILKDDVPYHDLGGDYFARRADPERITRRLVAQLERLGHTGTRITNAASALLPAPQGDL
jgi:peptidoglycan/xylan/chitin deacetylase (PgdA/CDA1 family)